MEASGCAQPALYTVQAHQPLQFWDRFGLRSEWMNEHTHSLLDAKFWTGNICRPALSPITCSSNTSLQTIVMYSTSMMLFVYFILLKQ